MSTPEQPKAEQKVEEVKGATGPTIVDPSSIFVPEGEGKGPFYAWSRFIKERDEDSGIVREWIMEGDKVSQADLDVGDEEWENLIKEGVVREAEYPVPKGESESPNEYYKKQLAIAAGEVEE